MRSRKRSGVSAQSASRTSSILTITFAFGPHCRKARGGLLGGGKEDLGASPHRMVRSFAIESGPPLQLFDELRHRAVSENHGALAGHFSFLPIGLGDPVAIELLNDDGRFAAVS